MQAGDAETSLFNTLNNNGYLTVTVLFLVLLFALSIANGVFYIRIYNQSKNEPDGTGIDGLTVTGSVVIGVISFIISVISIGWALYLLSRSYDLKTKISNWYTEKKGQAMEYVREKAIKMKFMQACSNNKIDTNTAQSILESLDSTVYPSYPGESADFASLMSGSVNGASPFNRLPNGVMPYLPSVPSATLPSNYQRRPYDAGASNNPFRTYYNP